MNNKLLEMKNVNKRFPGVYALKGIDFNLEAGEVHALLGENGAGKSTLMKILSGIYEIDEGEIFINGEKRVIEDVKDAHKNGISIIHQDLVLVPYMTVAENIYLGREILTKTGLVDRKAMVEKSQVLLDEFELDIKAENQLNSLTVAQQQMIEIIKAVSFESKIIVMDEPTSSLTEKEVEFLFKTINNLRNQGVGIVYISHRLDEIFEISDRVTVIRDGEYVGTVRTKETNVDELISMMVGRELKNYYIRDFNESGETVMSVCGLSKKGKLHNINFELKRGEILGFSGLVGAGRTDLMKCIFGIDNYNEGKIIVEGKEVNIKNPNDALNYNIAYVPEDRKEEGLFLIESVRFNMTIKILKEFISRFKVNSKYEEDISSEFIESLSIKTPSLEQAVNNLSGGNQQKVLIARWLLTKPKILILDEPTRGVDVGAKSEIYSIMNELVNSGVSIIMISSELPEIINMSDRVVIMHNGRIQKILDKEDFTQEKIMHYATGGN
ncbi:sugar ABC transporter ATP-binding protein [Clostridium sp. Cult2]|uniref:sugar ABC transporter ATP-binding protein n=1 Tax=Clostridium sp. Cult2 TaxID=2079003 RepID=UPI001F19C8FB|nr:sugar ABC transporter ATP-binding protein [Clostridium sp. Cult2]MCF6466225.1 D-xylose ABC transporter ATP-binding protein [Clostridium sp. Cult2]